MNFQADIKDIFKDHKISISRSDTFFQKTTKVIIYGAGNCGREVFSIMNKLKVPVHCFLDKNTTQGNQLSGVPVFQPGNESVPQNEKNRIVIIVAIFNEHTEIPPIIKKLKTLGYRRIISFLELHRNFPKILGTKYWLTEMSFYKSYKSHIFETFNLWSDKISQQLYTSILKFRFTGNYNILPKPDIKSQYFPPDLPKWKTPMRLIDCGACVGNTLATISKMSFPIEAIVAFEPDHKNFTKLTQFISSKKKALAKYIGLWPCGVYSQTKSLSFTSNGSTSSHLSSNGKERIQCVSLEEALPWFRPTLIKMDIEGAEYEALLGAKNMICKTKPRLAISIYHKPEHLWKIPMLIQGWSCGYKLYLRSHGFNGFDVVMYAIPPDEYMKSINS